MNSADSIDQFRRRFGNGFIEHQVVRPFTKLQCGGVADYFLTASSLQDLIDAVSLAGQFDLPCKIIGQGSKIVFSEVGFPGLVIVNRASNLSFIPGKSQVIAQSGVDCRSLVMQAANRDLAGLESLALAPGSLGGAIYANANVFSFDQYFKSRLNNFIKKITVINQRGQILTYSSSWVKVDGNLSKIKKSRENLVVLTATIQFYHSSKNDILARLRAKNPNKNNFEGSLVNVFLDPSGHSAEEIIWQSGAYKLKVESAGVDKRQLNTIINQGNASPVAVRKLIERIKEKVVLETNIMLEEAVEYVGQW